MTRGLLAAVHRLALSAYPRPFRQRFGEDLERAFEARIGAPDQTAGRRALLVAFHLADALLSGLVERVRAVAMRWSWPRESAALAASPRWSLFMTRESLTADFKLALRTFARAPLFAGLTVLTLALGIGATAAIFGVVYAVLLRPLPYADPGRLLMVWSDNTHNSEPNNPVSPANATAIQQEATSLAGAEYMYSFLIPAQIRVGPGDPDQVQTATLSAGMFALLGRDALVGRTFHAGEQEPTIVLSYAYWKRRFGGDVSIVGQTVSVSGITPPVRIVGVMPSDFVFPYRSMLGPTGFTRAVSADVWLPRDPAEPRFKDAAGQPSRTIHYLAVIGRMKPGVTVEAARADLEALATRRAAAFPDTNAGWGITVRPLHEQTVGAIRPALLILWAGVAVVLLITCVNVANVLLARATAQQRDLAIRSALGASRRRLIQQTLVESTTLALAGGLVGVGLMALGMRVLLALAPPDLPRLTEVASGAPVLLFALAISLITGLLVGGVPAWSAARSRAHDSMRDGQRTTASPARRRLRAALVVAEVTMAMTLTLGAALLLRSFVAVLSVNPGFAAEHLLTFQMTAPPNLATAAARLAYYDDLEARLRALPGVINVGGTTRLPLGSTNVTISLAVAGRSNLPAEMPEVEMRRSMFDYVGAMKIPVLRGRAFTREDGPGLPPTVLVNDTLANRVFPGEDPIGKQVALGGVPGPTASWLTIVGVIGSVKHGSLEETSKPEIYLNYRSSPPFGPFVVVRTQGDPAAVAASVREAVRASGADAPYSVLTMEQLRADSVGQRRFVLVLLGAFGLLALTLAAVGVYGVITLVVAERRAEVGIRLALGATPSQVGRLMVRQAVTLAAIGVAAGCVGGVAVAPWLRSAMFGVTAMDPATYASVGAILLGVAAGAAFVPARRAMRVDPIQALRHS